ncbi:MAG: ParB/RepB/Spo0J family partition protein [Bacteroidales bacterium]|nr:ParB/RepB/Spo0J family partition protein [Bacteroidales bacterium]
MSANKKNSLGRGLSAILSNPDTDITSKDASGNFVVGAVAEIPVTFIETNPFQPRDVFEAAALEELKNSILEQGVIQPVTVRKIGYDKYQLISGERRLRASIMAQLEKIPAYIRVADDQQMLEMALIENIHREDLNAIELALSYQRLMEDCGLKMEDVEKKISQDRSTITNYIRLLDLPPEIQVAVRDKKISMSHARTILGIDDAEQQYAVLQRIITENLSVRETEAVIQSLKQPVAIIKDKEKKQRQALPEKYETMRQGIHNSLKMNVDMKRSRSGKGTITLHFTNDEQLKRIVDALK